MERLTILVGRLYKSVALTKYFFKVPLVDRFMPLVGVIRRPVESPLNLSANQYSSSFYCTVVSDNHIDGRHDKIETICLPQLICWSN